MPKKKSSSSDLGVSGGKGDSPRSCFSKQFRDNYDAIEWHRAGNTPIEDFVKILNTPHEGDIEYSKQNPALPFWTKAHDDDREETYNMPEVPSNWNASVEEICNTSSPKPS